MNMDTLWVCPGCQEYTTRLIEVYKSGSIREVCPSCAWLASLSRWDRFKKSWPQELMVYGLFLGLIGGAAWRIYNGELGLVLGLGIPMLILTLLFGVR